MLTVNRAIKQGYRIDNATPSRPVAYRGSDMEPVDTTPCFNLVEEQLLRHLTTLVTAIKNGDPLLDLVEDSEHLINRITHK